VLISTHKLNSSMKPLEMRVKVGMLVENERGTERRRE